MATKPTKDGGDAKPYIVISPLDHDGQRYMPGDQVELTDTQAAPLMPHTVKPAKVEAAEKA